MRLFGRKISIFFPFFPDSRDERAVMCQRFIIGVVEIHNDQLSALIFVLFFFLVQVEPNSIAARDGRIKEGDRILQVPLFISVTAAGLNNTGI